jgi:NADH:ubiquinone oxidoreductase subunit D
MHQVEIATTQETLLDSPEMVLNMGPQHPSTHGVLRVVLKLDGETVMDLDCDIGYLHRGMEKIAENRMYTMIAPYWDRLDYIAAVSNGLVWVETVEQMMVLDVPPRAHYLRTILTELNRIASHLLWLATHALDIGAITVLLELLGRGFSNKEIAGELCLSVATVKHHVHHVLEKLQLQRRAQAMRKVREAPWIARVVSVGRK